MSSPGRLVHHSDLPAFTPETPSPPSWLSMAQRSSESSRRSANRRCGHYPRTGSPANANAGVLTETVAEHASHTLGPTRRQHHPQPPPPPATYRRSAPERSPGISRLRSPADGTGFLNRWSFAGVFEPSRSTCSEETGDGAGHDLVAQTVRLAVTDPLLCLPLVKDQDRSQLPTNGDPRSNPTRRRPAAGKEAPSR